MADRNVAMSVNVGGTLSNKYLRVMQTAEERQKRLKAALLIVRHWQPLKAFFGGFFRGVKTGFGPVAGALKPIAGFVGSIVRWFGRLFKPVDAGAGPRGRGRDAAAGRSARPPIPWSSPARPTRPRGAWTGWNGRWAATATPGRR